MYRRSPCRRVDLSWARTVSCAAHAANRLQCDTGFSSTLWAELNPSHQQVRDVCVRVCLCVCVRARIRQMYGMTRRTDVIVTSRLRVPSASWRRWYGQQGWRQTDWLAIHFRSITADLVSIQLDRFLGSLGWWIPSLVIPLDNLQNVFFCIVVSSFTSFSFIIESTRLRITVSLRLQSLREPVPYPRLQICTGAHAHRRTW